MDCADSRRILEVCAKIYVLRPVSLTISRIRAKGKEQRTQALSLSYRSEFLINPVFPCARVRLSAEWSVPRGLLHGWPCGIRQGA